MKTLTKNLHLVTIDVNNFNGAEVLAVVCFFKFFGEEGVAYISTSKLNSKNPSYGITEITSELSDSFNDLLEDHWEEISKEAKKFIKEYQKQFIED